MGDGDGDGDGYGQGGGRAVYSTCGRGGTTEDPIARHQTDEDNSWPQATSSVIQHMSPLPMVQNMKVKLFGDVWYSDNVGIFAKLALLGVLQTTDFHARGHRHCFSAAAKVQSSRRHRSLSNDTLLQQPSQHP